MIAIVMGRQAQLARTRVDDSSSSMVHIGMKTDRIQTDITDIVFVFIFMSGFGFKYG
jgi:hypothetical protein